MIELSEERFFRNIRSLAILTRLKNEDNVPTPAFYDCHPFFSTGSKKHNDIAKGYLRRMKFFGNVYSTKKGSGYVWSLTEKGRKIVEMFTSADDVPVIVKKYPASRPDPLPIYEMRVMAFQVTKSHIQDIAKWCRGVVNHKNGVPFIRIEISLNKVAEANLTDWVVKNHGGGIYVVENDSFQKLFKHKKFFYE